MGVFLQKVIFSEGYSWRAGWWNYRMLIVLFGGGWERQW